MNLNKKTMEDYQLQLRFGVRFSFDFYSHLDQNLGPLRHHIKMMKRHYNADSDGDDYH